ncbi:hypothetical protein [Dictyobacter halimunensis]
MADAYTVYWTHERCAALRRLGWKGRRLELLFGGPHHSEPSFISAGVRAGDMLYPIAVRSGELYIVGSARVRRILTLDDYIEQLTTLFADHLDAPEEEACQHSSSSRYGRALTPFERYCAAHPEVAALAPTCTSEVVECEESTPLRFDLSIPPDLLARLRYRSRRRERDLSRHLRDGRLKNTLALQGIYRLSESSAREVEALLQTSADAASKC